MMYLIVVGSLVCLVWWMWASTALWDATNWTSNKVLAWYTKHRISIKATIIEMLLGALAAAGVLIGYYVFSVSR